jgi:large subunit ribosomal protein L25
LIAVNAIGGYNAARFCIRKADNLPAAGSPVAGFIYRETSMFTINAEVRKEQGKGASRRLRAANKFPAIITVAKLLRLQSNWITTNCGTCRQS